MQVTYKSLQLPHNGSSKGLRDCPGKGLRKKHFRAKISDWIGNMEKRCLQVSTVVILLVSAVCFKVAFAEHESIPSVAARDAPSRFTLSRYLLTQRSQAISDSSCDSRSDCKYLGFTKPRCCNGQCVNAGTDDKHCGSCNNKCKKPGAKCCKGKCKLLSGSDRSNCGACGTKCKSGFHCCQGMCSFVAGGDRLNCGECGRKCRKGYMCCKGHCKNTSGNDRFNCGGCGKLCSFGADCCKGACKSVHGSDSSNCGGCGKKCKAGVQCNLGICGYND